MENVKSSIISSRVFPVHSSAPASSDAAILASITKVLVLPEGVFFASRVMVPLLFLSSGSPEGMKDVTLASYENLLSLSNTSTLILSAAVSFSPSGVRERVKGFRSPSPSTDMVTDLQPSLVAISVLLSPCSSKGSLHPCMRGIPINIAKKANSKV